MKILYRRNSINGRIEMEEAGGPEDQSMSPELAVWIWVGGDCAGHTPDECDALAAALTQAANRKRALDAERSVTP